MDQEKTTVKTKAADKLTVLRAARNTLANAIARYNRTQSVADRNAVLSAREEVHRQENLYAEQYKEGKTALLEHVCEKQSGYREKE